MNIDMLNVLPTRIDDCMPEGYMKVPDGAIPIDAINCAIYRALATTTMMHLSIDMQINKNILIEAVSAIEGYLNQISILTQHISIGTGAHQ